MTTGSYNRAISTSADRLASMIEQTCAPVSRVDWVTVTDLCLSSAAKRSFQDAFTPWLRKNCDVHEGLIHWAANPAVTAAGVTSKLRLFSRLVTVLVDAAIIMRGAAALIRKHGWVQGTPGAFSQGFDILGAVGAAADMADASPQLRVAVIEALRHAVQILDGSFITVTEWGDAPGRTQLDVLRLLSTCAAETESY